MVYSVDFCQPCQEVEWSAGYKQGRLEPAQNTAHYMSTGIFERQQRFKLKLVTQNELPESAFTIH